MTACPIGTTTHACFLPGSFMDALHILELHERSDHVIQVVHRALVHLQRRLLQLLNCRLRGVLCCGNFAARVVVMLTTINCGLRGVLCCDNFAARVVVMLMTIKCGMRGVLCWWHCGGVVVMLMTILVEAVVLSCNTCTKYATQARRAMKGLNNTHPVAKQLPATSHLVLLNCTQYTHPQAEFHARQLRPDARCQLPTDCCAAGQLLCQCC